MIHTCHAMGCEVPVDPTFLMCRPHWRRVPFPIQREVWKHYREGQCDDKRPSGEWMIAAERAIVAVAVYEKRLTPEQAQARVEREIDRFAPKAPAVRVNMRNNEPFDVRCDRGSIYGNPYSHVRSTYKVIMVPTRAEAVMRYRRWLLGLETVAFAKPPSRGEILLLRGKRLGCWCGAHEQCHVDVLIDWINADGDIATLEELFHNKQAAETVTRCSVCGEPQFDTMSGMTCSNGHGGAPALEPGAMTVEQAEALLKQAEPGARELARQLDTVTYSGRKPQGFHVQNVSTQGDDHIRDRGADEDLVGGDPLRDADAEHAPEGEDPGGPDEDRSGDGDGPGSAEAITTVAPFIRWVGGKAWATSILVDRLTRHLRPQSRYVEPFLGSGAIALAMASRTPGLPMILADFCGPLMGLWYWIKNRPDDLDRAFDDGDDWTVSEENYYRIRDAFRQETFSVRSPLPAARFLWLNRTGYNGVYRENANGVYNVPWGKKKTITLPSGETLRGLSQHLRNAHLFLGYDFEQTLKSVRRGDVVFVDPPYDGVYDDYLAGGFGVENQIRLARVLHGCVDRGAFVYMTNADTPRIRELYASWDLEPLSEPRHVAAKASSRQKAACLLCFGVPY